MGMNEQPGIPEVAEVVRHWMPDATEEEQKVATNNMRNYLAAVYRIVLRLEAEGRLCDTRDKYPISDTVAASNDTKR